MTIGNRIKELRKKYKVTQKHLSQLTGIAEITIRQYEADKYKPKIENLQKIADALSISIADLIPPDSILQKEQLTLIEELKYLMIAIEHPIIKTELGTDQVLSLKNKISEEIESRSHTLDLSLSLTDSFKASLKKLTLPEELYQQSISYQQGYISCMIALGYSPNLIATYYDVPFTDDDINSLLTNRVITKAEAENIREYRRIIDSKKNN